MNIISGGRKPFDVGMGNESDKIANSIVLEEFKILHADWVADNESKKYKIDMYLYATAEDKAAGRNPLCGLELDRLLSNSWKKGQGYYKATRSVFGRKKKMVYQTPMRVYHLQLNNETHKGLRDGFVFPWVIALQSPVSLQKKDNNDSGELEEVFNIDRRNLVFGIEKVEKFIILDALHIYNTAGVALGRVALTPDVLLRNRNIMVEVFNVVNQINNAILRQDIMNSKEGFVPKSVYEDEKIEFEPYKIN